MAGNPIKFSDDEIAFILTHQGPGPEHLSWGDIARHLNREFFTYNKGKRGRDSVYGWMMNYIEKSKDNRISAV